MSDGFNPLTDGETGDSRYRLLIDAITDYAVFMLDASGMVASWNPGARRFKGYEASEIIGRHFSLFYTAEDRAIGLPDVALRTAAEEGRFENEGWRVRKDGTRFWAHVMIDPIRSPSGQLIGFAKVTRDLTERKRAQRDLQHSEEQFRLLIQSVTDYAIYMLDPDGNVASWNLGAERTKGYRPEEIIGRHFSEFYTPEDRERGLPQRGLSIAAREGRFESEGWRQRKDGTRFWSSIVIDAIRGDDGRLIGFAKITRDITQRREAEIALERAREALLQSQKMEALGQLTGGVAHDFNNLLMAVLGSLSLVRKRIGHDPALFPLIDNAIQGAQRGAALTQRMLSFARRQPLDLGPIEIPTLVDNLSQLLQSSLGSNYDVETDFSPALPAAHGDGNQLGTALLNLVVNARDAMPDGGLVTIAACEETDSANVASLPPGRYVRLTVTDRGEGMDQATLARAAEPFFTTKGIGKGTGLGLSMVHGMAEQSGGRLKLSSVEGEGTTAQLWLPVSQGSAKVAGMEPTNAFDSANGRVFKSLRILAVDDDDLVLMNTAAMLAELGHHVFEARSASQALEILDNTPVELVISDQAMPKMTGLQLAHAIRKRWPDLPVILATGYSEASVLADLTLPKIAKPFLQGDLDRAIRAVVTD